MTLTAEQTTMASRIPPGPRLPKWLLHLMCLVSRRQTMRALHRRYGSAFSMNLLTGPIVIISDPALVRQLFMTSSDIAGNLDINLGRIFGPGSLFGLEGERHHHQRKLLAPPFHGQRMQSYEAAIEEATMREAASWPEGEPIEMFAPMTRITLNVMLRAIFGPEMADGGERPVTPELDALRTVVPRLTALGSRLFLLPGPRIDLGRLTPWGRYNGYRRQFDAIIDTLIARVKADPAFADRRDVLSIMLRARYEDGVPMSRHDIADEVLTLLAAGHETTAGSLAWAVERLRRHPQILARLVEEADAGGAEFRRAAVYEIQRIRSAIDLTGRRVNAPAMELGPWVIPNGYGVLVGISLMHSDDAIFPDADTFNPERFLGTRPDRYALVPFGGGSRRCLGDFFAEMEINIVLRTLLREFELIPTTEPDEGWHSRGIAFTPSKGGCAVLRRRSASPSGAADRAREKSTA